MTPQEQARAFAAMLLCGICLGMVYDLLSPLRRTAGLGAASDLLFGLVCAAGVILTALSLQCEPFRLYTLLGAGCGIALYGATLGRVFRWLRRNVWKRPLKKEEK